MIYSVGIFLYSFQKKQTNLKTYLYLNFCWHSLLFATMSNDPTSSRVLILLPCTKNREEEPFQISTILSMFILFYLKCTLQKIAIFTFTLSHNSNKQLLFMLPNLLNQLTYANIILESNNYWSFSPVKLYVFMQIQLISQFFLQQTINI